MFKWFGAAASAIASCPTRPRRSSSEVGRVSGAAGRPYPPGLSSSVGQAQQATFSKIVVRVGSVTTVACPWDRCCGLAEMPGI